MVSVGSELTSFDTGPDSVYKIQGNEMEPKNLDPSHPHPNFFLRIPSPDPKMVWNQIKSTI